jgi:DNA-binding transcriptional LysR family regulator
VARDLLAALDRVEREIREPRTQERRLLRLSTERFTAYHWLPWAVRKLSLQHPQVDLGSSQRPPAIR